MRSIAFAAAIVAVTLTSLAPHAHADAYPSKAVRFVIPFPPGGATDIFGRLVAEKLTESLGQPVVVDNRAGAGGNIGADYVAKSPPDGHSILLGTIGTHAINPSLYPSIPYDAARDFEPVAMLLSIPNVLVVHPQLPVQTVAELVAHAKQHPGKLTFGSSGNGSSIHLSGELFKHLTGTDILHVPYRGGAASVNDLIAGRIDMMFDNLPVSLPHIRAGSLRILGVSTRTRTPVLPDVPTIDGAGVPGYEATAWAGIFVPARTPKEIIDRLHAEVKNALESESLQRRFAELGAVHMPMSVDEFRAFVASELEKWAGVVKAAKVRIE